MIWKYCLLWLGLVVIAIANGTIRQSTYLKWFGELKAHQLSTLTGLILFAVYIWAVGHRWKLESANQAIMIGVMWLGMTIAFEFLFGHYVMKHPWSQLLHDYNLAAGRVWVLVLIWTAIAPYVFYRLRTS
jgi:hypothetical protein